MSVTGEDKRAASAMVVAFSTFLLTASLTVLAALAAYFTFVLQYREPLTLFWILASVGFVAQIVSAIYGGRGIYYVAVQGSVGDWPVKTKNGAFDKQSVWWLLGTATAFASVFFTKPLPLPETPPTSISESKAVIDGGISSPVIYAEWAIAGGTVLLAGATLYLAGWARRQTIETRKASQIAAIDGLLREMSSRDHQEAYFFVQLHAKDLNNDRESYNVALLALHRKVGYQLQPIELLGSYYQRVEAYIEHGLVDEELIMPQVSFGTLMVWHAIGPIVKPYRNDNPKIGVDFEKLVARAEKYEVLPKSVSDAASVEQTPGPKTSVEPSSSSGE